MAIRKIEQRDADIIKNMMSVFYASPAVSTNGSEEIFSADLAECLSNSPYLEGYVFEEDGKLAGYAMLAKSFSTEFGMRCIWVEDIYILPEYRRRGIGKRFFMFVFNKYPNCVIRLEAERENTPAVNLYEKMGFGKLEYLEMIKMGPVT